MNLVELWETLTPKKENIEIIKKDLSVGIAPHLPFFVIGLDGVKSKLSEYLSKIDTSFQYCLIKGQYGNGKTNLLKYLEYFFEVHHEYNVHCETWRADVDKYDLNLFLLYLIQQSHATSLKSFFKQSSEDIMKTACNDYKDSFAVMQGYTKAIINNKDDDDKLLELIQLGTGAKYDKRSFDKYRIDKFSDYNRHEVLVFFLNIFALNKYYILFCIDELEKIEEKSRARFQSYLTSFRELIDMAGLIRGHMLIAAITDAGKWSSMPLEAYNPAFGRRIITSTHELKSISNQDEIKKLAESLCSILGESCQDKNIDLIVSKIEKQHLSHTNEIIISLYNNLTFSEYKSWREKFKDSDLNSRLASRIEALKDEGVEVRIHTKFFAPLENYLNIIWAMQLTAWRECRYYYDILDFKDSNGTVASECTCNTGVTYMRLNKDTNISRIKNVQQLFPTDKLCIFKPEGLGISNSDLQDYGIANVDDVIIYDPIELMALLTLFVEDYDNDMLKDAIVEYTKGL